MSTYILVLFNKNKTIITAILNAFNYSKSKKGKSFRTYLLIEVLITCQIKPYAVPDSGNLRA